MAPKRVRFAVEEPVEDRDSVLKRAFILPRKLTLAVHSHRMSSEEQIAQVLQENATMRQQLLICQARVREQNMQLRIRDGNIEDLQSRLQQVQRHYDDLRQHDDYLAQKKRKRDDDAAAAATKEVQELVNRVQDVEQQLAACRADLAQRRLSGAGSAEPRQQQQQQAGGGGAQPPVAAAQPAAEGGGGHAQGSGVAAAGAPPAAGSGSGGAGPPGSDTVEGAAALAAMQNAPHDGAPAAPNPQEPSLKPPSSS
ncbi:hypothetical protein CHLNCDRAFT_59495 [Chlorella variabilis]|uniref:Uncharacterized protein n=1 Tax=Chlorella variabilis TaxID=554065 RepID=E1ZUG1_CHLVA|nr:hypothetical protein CHLNCDRAFT_59495 [Chlorella variabilis]EFN50534.1 hypothetical protein CHLNCDRAFT_59495 [Chlorella variabilis]|eukprot:XP_005842666.1 hypothetical protein CHLNCDRAFT_59495 [Chlorella variabilis]